MRAGTSVYIYIVTVPVYKIMIGLKSRVTAEAFDIRSSDSVSDKIRHR